MKVPLSVKTVVGRDNKQYIEVWTNGSKGVVKAPFDPYFYSSYEMKLSVKHDNEILNKILLSSGRESKVFKYSFPNVRYVSQYRESDNFESDIVFTDRILIDESNFFLNYPNKNKLKVLFFDIETDSIGIFPTPERNAIIGIGCKCGDKKKLFISDTYDNDELILKKFFDFIRKTDPDILAHYNGNKFDIPYIIARMKKWGIPLNMWTRSGQEPYEFKDTIFIDGRVSFDIYNEVMRDQTLFGIKNHKMKTVAKWIDKQKKLDIKEIELSNMRSLVGTDTLKEYLKSDVLVTEFLFNVYFKNVLMLAEMLGIPLNLIVDSSPSFIPQIIHGRYFGKMNIISNGTNEVRNTHYISNKRGAIVDTYEPGLYKNKIYKIDYSSQYPRAVQTFNISPENVKILNYSDYDDPCEYDSHKYKFDIKDKNNYIFYIPDIKAGKIITISVDMSKRGFLPKFMDDVLTERFEIKKRMKSIDKDSTEYGYLHVRQNALKIIANVQTGYEGQSYARFGSLACYNMITGMCRYYVMMAIDWCRNKGIKVISVDTDGIFIDQKIDMNELNSYLDEQTNIIFGLKNHLHLDIDEFDGAFFRNTKGKHYVLKSGDNVTFHGQSFKGSHMPKFWDSLLEEVARTIFTENVKKYHIDVRKYSVEELMQSIKVKPEYEYKTNSSLSMQLIKKAKEELKDINFVDGDQLNYIKCKSGYELVLPWKEYHDIDYKYYEGIVDKVFERLEIHDTKQLTLSDIK